MSDKHLSELEWKRFAKGRSLKDAALTKSLAALERASAPEQALAALDDLSKQAAQLRKAGKGDKELNAYLDAVDTALERQRKLSELELRKAAKDEGEDEEAETPALLTTKMLPLVRQVQKGEEMQVLLANTSKETAVLLSRRGIPPSRRKLLADYLGGGTPKYISGICLFEENAHTFVLKSPAAGLAKKLKAALLKQVDLRVKVRVRGEDPDDIDEDHDADDTATPDAAPAGRAEPAGAADASKAHFDARWKALATRMGAALENAPADLQKKIGALAKFASQKASTGDTPAALQAIAQLEHLLDSGVARDSEAPPPPALQAEAFKQHLVALLPSLKKAIAAATPGSAALQAKLAKAGDLAKAHRFNDADRMLDELASALERAGQPASRNGPAEKPATPVLPIWTQAREDVDDQLGKLQTMLKRSSHPLAAVLADRGLHGVTRRLQVGLQVDLIEFDNASEVASRERARSRLQTSIASMRQFIDGDPLVPMLEDNPYGTLITLRSTLSGALSRVERLIEA